MINMMMMMILIHILSKRTHDVDDGNTYASARVYKCMLMTSVLKDGGESVASWFVSFVAGEC